MTMKSESETTVLLMRSRVSLHGHYKVMTKLLTVTLILQWLRVQSYQTHANEEVAIEYHTGARKIPSPIV